MQEANLDQLKADFFEKNAALVKAIEQTTDENCNSFRNKSDLASSRLKVIGSYHRLVSYVVNQPKFKDEKQTQGWF